MLRLLRTLIVKELQVVLRDRQSRALLIAPVVLQAILFPLAATLEVRNATIAIYDRDGGAAAIEVMQRVGQAQAFTRVLTVRSEDALRDTLDRQQALLAVVFPPDFSRNVAAGRPAKVQCLLDGRRSNSAQIALSYVQRIVESYASEHSDAAAGGAALVVRHWFNPNLDYRWFLMPSLVAIITTVGALIVTALSLAREREQGTLDQLLVTPLTPALIMVGKAIPAVVIAILQATAILLIGVFVYGVPFAGTLLLLYGAMVFYALALVGFGLFISALSNTQQQAFLGVFAFMMPAVLLSGYIAPIENMPAWLQPITWFNPLRHFIVVAKGVYLKDIGLASVAADLWPLLLIAAVMSTAALLLFRRQIA
ncbi:MAG: ABC transporter permease [Steroidobacteraceae bacterium]